jgi:iron complex transport system substrate-binding protein
MFKSIPRIFILLALLICGAARAEDQTTSTMRIVVCAPSLAEYVYEVGMFDRVVGVSRFTEFPPEAAALPAVTDFANPGLEAITALKPTVIIALQSNTAVVEFFSKQQEIQVIQIGKCETFRDSLAAIGKIREGLDQAIKVRGKSYQAVDANGEALTDPKVLRDQNLTQHDENIREIIRMRQSEAKLRAKFQFAEANPPGPNSPKVLMILGGDELRPGGVTAIGRGTHISELLEMAGAWNVLPADLGVYPMLNKEAILRYDPDMILFLSETPQDATSAAKARASWASVLPTLKAVKREDGFRYINDSRLMIPGPRAMGALPAMREALGIGAQRKSTPTTGAP